MMYRQGKNAILCASVWFKVSNLQLCRSCSVRAKMAACENTLCFVCVWRFFHLPPFRNKLRLPKITCICSKSQRKRSKLLFNTSYFFVFCSQQLAFLLVCCDGVEVIMWREKRNSFNRPHTKANHSW